MQKRLEQEIESEFVRRAKKAGFTVLKMQTIGPRGIAGYPDRLVLLGDGRHVWIEFKATGKVHHITPLQERRISQLQERGDKVLVTDDEHVAMAWVEEQ